MKNNKSEDIGYYGDGKNVRSKGLVVVSLGLHRGMEPQCANVSAVSFAGSPLVELETYSCLGKPLFLIHFFIGHHVIFKLNFSCRLLYWKEDAAKLI